MKKVIYRMIATIVVVGLIGCAAVSPNKSIAQEALAIQSEPGPIVVVGSPMTKMSNKAQVIIMGTGFKPGQKVIILFTTMDGVQADIGYALKPQPVASNIGTWVTRWSCGRFIKTKLIKEGAQTITVTNSEYNPLAHTPIAFYNNEKSAKK